MLLLTNLYFKLTNCLLKKHCSRSLPTCKNAIVSLIHGKYENNVVHRSWLLAMVYVTGLLMKSTSFLVVTVSIANVKFNSKQTSSIGIIAKDLLVYLQKHGKET